MSESASPLAHPRLFLAAADLPALRTKASHPALAPWLAEVRQRGEAMLDPRSPAYLDLTLNRTQLVGVTHSMGHTWHKLPDLLLLYLLSGEARWLVPLTGFLRTMTQDSSPLRAYIFGHAPKTNHDTSLLGGATRWLSTQCGMVPLLYDCLYEQLAPADRQATEAYLTREVVDPFLDYLLDASREPAFQQHLGINLGWWDFYACFWSLAALYDPSNPRHRQGLEAAARRVRHGLHMGADAAGIIGEGSGYGTIEIFNWWTSAEILRRLGGPDFWASDARFLQVMRARLYYLLPGPHGLLDHGDTARDWVGWYGNSLLVMLLHGQRTGDPAFQAAWEAFASLKPAEAVRPNMHGPLGSLAYFLWIDPDRLGQPLAPVPSQWPQVLPGDRYGLHVIRDGWRADSFYAAFFHAGRSPGTYIHQHSDAGHFALAAGGELFAAGRGYGHTPAAHHNVLRLNGAEPPDAPRHANGQSWRGGTLLAAGHGRHSHYVAADLAWQWQACWYHRHFMVLRFPGTAPYLVLLDHANLANDWATYDWQLQVQPSLRAELDEAGQRASLHGPRHRLELGWATLAAGEYPKPAALTLHLEDRPHIYADAPGHPHHSAAVPSCLVARLQAYSGVLLSALVPRQPGQPPLGLTRHHAPRQLGLSLDHGDYQDQILASPLTRRLMLGGVDAEASLLAIRRDRHGRVLAVSAADCFSVTVDGQELLPAIGHCQPLFEYRHASLV